MKDPTGALTLSNPYASARRRLRDLYAIDTLPARLSQGAV